MFTGAQAGSLVELGVTDTVVDDVLTRFDTQKGVMITTIIYTLVGLCCTLIFDGAYIKINPT